MSVYIITMKSSITLLLLALTANATSDLCNTCTEMVTTFDTLDSVSVSNAICPLLDESVCEDIMPTLLGHIVLDCGEICTQDISVARKFGHHPFDIPHHEAEEEEPQHHNHKHLFDIPHHEKTDPISLDEGGGGDNVQ